MSIISFTGKIIIAKISGLGMTLIFLSSQVSAGAYIFADEINGVNVITHPSPYNGSGGVVTVRVCIDPGSPNASEMEYSIQNNVDVYNQLLPTTGNVKLGANNNVPASTIDFESVALHEIGHCLGMAHINAASESGLTGNKQNYTKATKGIDDVFNTNAGTDGVIGSSDDVRGDDDNLVWFRRSNNDPFTIDSVVDSTTYSRNLTDLPAGHNYAANADRAVSTLLGYVKTEAVMQQGTYFDEAQRTLGHDDVATLRYAASGINENEVDGNGAPNQDNYSIVLEYGGISTANCDVSMSFTTTPGLAFCSVSGVGIDENHIRISNANIEFGEGYNWHFNAANTAPVLNAIGDLVLTEGDNLVVTISATDADNDALSFSSSGLPSFASIIDNTDGTATLTIAPVVGDASISTATVTVTDDAALTLSDNETFDIAVAALDTDLDGISDYDEINLYGTLPDNDDSDADGLNDFDELFTYFTLPNTPDSDGDFIIDGDEVNNSSNPLDPLSWPALADGDIAPLGAPDGVINAADYLIAQRIVLGTIAATTLELAHADLYPPGSPDGVINTSDLILLLQLLQQ